MRLSPDRQPRQKNAEKVKTALNLCHMPLSKKPELNRKTMVVSIVRRISTLLTASFMMLFFLSPASAQSKSDITAVLKDASNGEVISFATISITKKGATSPSKYALTGSDGKGTIEKVAAGTYTFKAEMMGYVASTQEIVLQGKNLDLGVVNLQPDKEVLDAASVSAVGNPIVVKKDTIEYNASSFKITDNDVLEDLLRKFPGIEVGDDGSITANGQTITKIYVDGKTYFMDDPTLASKNLPAKIINKVKVVRKKSDQAEFTGIDDGEEETVLDLSVKQGMMNGLMGNVRAGIGHDFPVDEVGYDEHRYNGNLFLGNFSNGAQYSVIGNVNNGNNVGFGGFGREMMGGMRGGSGGGVTTSYMLGANLGYDFFDDRMEAMGNYNFNGSDSDIRSSTYKEQIFQSANGVTSTISNTDNISNSKSNSHNVGLRIEHEFSKNSSLIFEPQLSFGKSSRFSSEDFETFAGDENRVVTGKQNDGFSVNSGDSKRVSASGRLQYRQRIGLPGRTLVFNSTFSLSDSDDDAFVQSLTNSYLKGQTDPVASIINQRTENTSRTSSLMGRLTYTEPMGNNFYVEGNYSLTWRKSDSGKNAWDSGLSEGFGRDNLFYNPEGETFNKAYSNSIFNDVLTQQAGVNLLYQGDKLRMQVGVSINPTRTHNRTEKAGTVIDTTYSVLNWSPQARVDYQPIDNLNARFNYRGRSNQPSVSQLVPVLDNSNPIAQSLGNPYLNPYFSHDVSAEVRYNNRETFSSFNLRLGGGLTQSPIVNATWNESGKTYSMPVNGPNSTELSARLFANIPIAKSNFSISNNTSASTNRSSSYTGSNVGTDKYFVDGDFDYVAFRNDFRDFDSSPAFARNDIRNYNISENLTFVYRSDALEIRLGGSTRYSKSDYSLNKDMNRETWNNGVNGSFIWTWNLTGLSLRSDINYRWYEGYTVEMPSEAILNAEISKTVLRKQATVALNVYDLLGQTRNFSTSDSGNSHIETKNNALGRYVILSFTWRFGTIGGRNGRNSRNGRPPMDGGAPMGPPPGGGGRMMGPPPGGMGGGMRGGF